MWFLPYKNLLKSNVSLWQIQVVCVGEKNITLLTLNTCLNSWLNETKEMKEEKERDTNKNLMKPT